MAVVKGALPGRPQDQFLLEEGHNRKILLRPGREIRLRS